MNRLDFFWLHPAKKSRVSTPRTELINPGMITTLSVPLDDMTSGGMASGHSPPRSRGEGVRDSDQSAPAGRARLPRMDAGCRATDGDGTNCDGLGPSSN